MRIGRSDDAAALSFASFPGLEGPTFLDRDLINEPFARYTRKYSSERLAMLMRLCRQFLGKLNIVDKPEYVKALMERFKKVSRSLVTLEQR